MRQLQQSHSQQMATAVATNSNIVLNFSEAVVIETGNFIIDKTSDNSAVETIDVKRLTVTWSLKDL